MALLAILAGTALAGSSLFQIQQTREAAQDQRRARQKQAKIASLQNARERRRALAEARVLRARNIAAAVNSGTSQSSTLEGANASIASSTAANIGFSSALEGLDKQRLNALESAASATSRAQVAGAVSNLASAAFGGANAFQLLGKGFSGGSAPTSGINPVSFSNKGFSQPFNNPLPSYNPNFSLNR